MGRDVLVGLVASEGKLAVEALPDGATLEERFRAAARVCHHHWMVLDEDAKYAGMCEAVYALADTEERERIVTELRTIKTLNAMLSGVPVDFERIEKLDNPIGILNIWRETCS